MTPDQLLENEAIKIIVQQLQTVRIDLNNITTKTKGSELTNKIKHHQTIMNLDYALEVVERAINLLNESKNK